MARSADNAQFTLENDTTTTLTRSGDTEFLIHLLIRSGGSPALETVLLVRILLPSESLEVIVSDMIHARPRTKPTERASTDNIGAPLLSTLNL
jgi:hypothetical protein